MKMFSAKIGVCPYFSQPEELWVYSLPLIAYARRCNAIPVFVERDASSMARVWQATQEKLSQLGITDIPRRVANIACFRQGGIGDSLACLLTESEATEVILEQRWSRIISVLYDITVVPVEDRRIICERLSQEGVYLDPRAMPPGETAAKLSKLGITRIRLLRTLSDLGIGEQVDWRRSPAINIMRILGSHFSSFQSSQAKRISKKEIMEVVAPLVTNEEKDLIEECLSNYADQEGCITWFDFFNVRRHIMAILLRRINKIRASMRHITRPLLNIALEDTLFRQSLAQRMKERNSSRVMVIDVSSNSGIVILRAELILKSFLPDIEYSFGVVDANTQYAVSDFSGNATYDCWVTCSNFAFQKGNPGHLAPIENNPGQNEVVYLPSGREQDGFLQQYTYRQLIDRCEQEVMPGDENDYQQLCTFVGEFIREHENLFKDIPQTLMPKSHPGLDIRELMVEQAIRSPGDSLDKLMKQLILLEYFQNYYLFKNNINDAYEPSTYLKDTLETLIRVVGQVIAQNPSSMNRLRTLDSRCRYISYRNILRRWIQEKETIDIRSQSTLAILGKPEVLNEVKRFLNGEIPFEKIRPYLISCLPVTSINTAASSNRTEKAIQEMYESESYTLSAI